MPKDLVQAVKWYRLAGEQGFLNAQNKLGVMYAEGRGVPKDNAEAMKWYRKAAEQGDAQAQTAVDALLASDVENPKPTTDSASPTQRPPVDVAGRKVTFQTIPGDRREVGWVYINVCSKSLSPVAEDLRQRVQGQTFSSMRLIAAEIAYFNPPWWECVHGSNSLQPYVHTPAISGEAKALSATEELMTLLSKYGVAWEGGVRALSRIGDDSFRFDVWIVPGPARQMNTSQPKVDGFMQMLQGTP